MSTQAFLTTLGRSLPQRDFYASRPAWLTACEQEEVLLRAVEKRISAQKKKPVRLVGTALDGSQSHEGDPFDLMLGETIGGTDGLAPLQGFVVWMLFEGRMPPNYRYDDPYTPLRRAREVKFFGPLADFRHLLDHDPLDGYYLPVDFPTPIWIPGSIREEAFDISFGSAHQLLRELKRWEALSRTVKVPDSLEGYCENLALVNRAALRTGLAMAIA